MNKKAYPNKKTGYVKVGEKKKFVRKTNFGGMASAVRHGDSERDDIDTDGLVSNETECGILYLGKVENDSSAEKKLLNMLGFAVRSRNLVCGTDAVCDAIRSSRDEIGNRKPGKNKVSLVLVSAEASANTKKRIINCCNYYRVEYAETVTETEKFAHAVGKTGSLSAVGVTDANFISAIKKIINESVCAEKGSNPGPDPSEGR